MNQVILSSAFQRQLKKLIKQNPKLKEKTAKILKLLIKNISHSSLKLHKLSGENNWSISLTYNLRMVIHLEGHQIYCLRVGSHDQIY